MTESIRVYKQDHIRIKTGGKTVRIDPFMVDDPCNDADIILITHSHHDHFSRLSSELREGVDMRHAVEIGKSRYNLQLEDTAACLLAVQDFMDNGGIQE